MNGIKTKALSIGLGGIAAVSLLMTGGQAHAQACPTNDLVSVVDVPGFSCTLGDKTFSAFTISGAPSTALVDFGQTGGGLLFAVTLSRDGTFFSPGTVVFDYTIAAAAPNVIRMGTLGVDVSFPTVITTTTMNGLTPNSMGMIIFTPGVGSVTVDNTSVISGLGVLNSVSNNFAQMIVGVPEPASLSLFGLGLLGIGFARRRRS